ncbi:MAG: PilZ domain-containing protein [Pseudomonadota bacterium]
MQAAQERRTEPRQRVLKTGKIAFMDNKSSFDCTVRNRSAHGARLRMATPEFVPANFILHIPSDNFRAQVQVVNRTATEIGVRLIA